jgi:hypothetical protein
VARVIVWLAAEVAAFRESAAQADDKIKSVHHPSPPSPNPASARVGVAFRTILGGFRKTPPVSFWNAAICSGLILTDAKTTLLRYRGLNALMLPISTLCQRQNIMKRDMLALFMASPSSQCIHTLPNGSGFDCPSAQHWQ